MYNYCEPSIYELNNTFLYNSVKKYNYIHSTRILYLPLFFHADCNPNRTDLWPIFECQPTSWKELVYIADLQTEKMRLRSQQGN